MNYQMTLYQGFSVGMADDFDVAAFTDKLNQTTADAVSIGSISTLKGNIRDVQPERVEGEEPAGQKLLIYTNRRAEPYVAYAENYDADEVSKQFNDRQKTFLLIGDVMIHRNEYSMIMPAPDQL